MKFMSSIVFVSLFLIALILCANAVPIVQKNRGAVSLINACSHNDTANQNKHEDMACYYCQCCSPFVFFLPLLTKMGDGKISVCISCFFPHSLNYNFDFCYAIWHPPLRG